jgi:hypothetical protein
MKKKRLGLLVALAAFVFGSGSASAVVDCTGTVTNLSLQLNSEGVITLSLSSGPSYTYLCGTEVARNNVPPGICKTMYATLMAAKLAGKSVLIRFYDYDTCSAVPAWGDAGTLGWTQLLLD